MAIEQVRGLDVSIYQGPVNWAATRMAGISFAFAKATEGVHVGDPFFHANWRGMKEAGIVRGAYHFFLPNRDAAQQARHFAATVKLEPGDLPPVLDVEKPGAGSRRSYARAVKLWLHVVEQETGRRPIIYTYAAFWSEQMTDQFGDHPLWIAHYRVAQPRIPKGWSHWTFWQYSSTGRKRGVSGPVDLNRFNGSHAQLLALTQPHGKTAAGS